ncbi:lipopolysaccharide biosynthesis protein [Heyndrickxia coagulans]|uniref:Polysaccharide biosynthesis C-terminal domain-containing protein n=1 Tax=Heyndrickxia coagulans TaxID=1398 RepID=A0AAW7CA19_HEYCO|nr:polysaccharide biosynthesis C-terminal domain-containing protein [Heyndrickxia coagulans]MDL5039752.1 polysaccharide biosynthesis C-terminal domain-containing protein [Heyndrickxia coagulans]
MNKYKNLVNNSFLFAVGNLGTKLITFFLVPIYTYYMTTKEYGIVDILTTTVSVVMPIVTLSIHESVLRFVMDKTYDKKQILMNSIFVVIIGFICLLPFYNIMVKFIPYENGIAYFYIILLFQSLYVIFQQYIRAEKKIKLFALSGIFYSIVLFALNIIYLIILNYGIKGYLLSLILTNFISCLFLIFGGQIYKDLFSVKLNIKQMKELLNFSIPLIPNAIMWWVMNLSDRYLIIHFLGLSANGLYAVANKIPNILNMINSIFFQAWQMSAIEEYRSKDRSEFYSNTFNAFSFIMLISTSFLLILLKPILNFSVANDYYIAWMYVPFLLLGSVFASFAGFLGTNYIASKNTTGVFKTSVIGAIINILLNLLLIPKMGVNGASFSTMVSFLVIWVLRIIDTKKFVRIRLQKTKLILSLIIIALQIVILYIDFNLEYLVEFILFCIQILINIKLIKGMFKRLFNLILYKVKKYIGSAV